jgi:formylglycine-generating enzyme required for sulfatase activity
MGSTVDDPEGLERETPQHEAWLPAYSVARYPVTNAQWRRFVDDGGYENSHWWLPVGWTTRVGAGWNTPRTWNDPAWIGNDANRPVVGVSWYEALAYASWLSSRLDYRVAIGTEVEWEKAARGVDGRRYPFGNTLDRQALHVCASGQIWKEAPAPVGCYPRGVSPWGVEDMVGNTYSWTRSRWGAHECAPSFGYPSVHDDGRDDLESDEYRVVRGGGWSFPLGNARCAYRGKDRPYEAFNNVGVRLVTRRIPAPRRPSPAAGKEQA